MRYLSHKVNWQLSIMHWAWILSNLHLQVKKRRRLVGQRRGKKRMPRRGRKVWLRYDVTLLPAFSYFSAAVSTDFLVYSYSYTFLAIWLQVTPQLCSMTRENLNRSLRKSCRKRTIGKKTRRWPILWCSPLEGWFGLKYHRLEGTRSRSRDKEEGVN